MLTHMHADMHENALIQNLITIRCHEEWEVHIEELGHSHIHAAMALCWVYSYLSNPEEQHWSHRLITNQIHNLLVRCSAPQTVSLCILN